jgi:hypothetical protein
MGCQRDGGPADPQVVSSAVPVDISAPPDAGKHGELGHGIVDIRFHGFRRPSRFWMEVGACFFLTWKTGFQYIEVLLITLSGDASGK